MNSYDIIIIGGGPGGYVAAIKAAQCGKNVACIEKEPIMGGTCLRVGCIPSKAMLESSELYHESKYKYAAHGIKLPEVGLDLGIMLKRKEQVVKNLAMGIDTLLAKNKITRYHGTARFTAPDKILVASSDAKEH